MYINMHLYLVSIHLYNNYLLNLCCCCYSYCKTRLLSEKKKKKKEDRRRAYDNKWRCNPAARVPIRSDGPHTLPTGEGVAGRGEC